MNNAEAARYRAYGLAIEHLRVNTAITDAVPAFKEVFQEAADIFASITGADLTRLVKTHTAYTGKQQFQEELVNNAMLISSSIITYAARNNKQEMLQSMNFTPSELVYANDADLGSRAGNILATAQQLNGQLQHFGVSDELLKTFAEQVKNYVPLSGKPRTHVVERKAAGQSTRDHLRRLREIFDFQLDSLMLHFRVTYPDFYNTYIMKRTVVNPARRKTRIEGLVTDISGSGLGDVQIKIKEAELATITLADGSYSLKTAALAGATIEFNKEGYKTITITIDIKRGQVLNQPVTMEKIG
jgi:hypothetical protein